MADDVPMISIPEAEYERLIEIAQAAYDYFVDPAENASEHDRLVTRNDIVIDLGILSEASESDDGWRGWGKRGSLDELNADIEAAEKTAATLYDQLAEVADELDEHGKEVRRTLMRLAR